MQWLVGKLRLGSAAAYATPGSSAAQRTLLRCCCQHSAWHAVAKNQEHCGGASRIHKRANLHAMHTCRTIIAVESKRCLCLLISPHANVLPIDHGPSLLHLPTRVLRPAQAGEGCMPLPISVGTGIDACAHLALPAEVAEAPQAPAPCKRDHD